MQVNGRADHIEDYLCTVRTGQWFGWSDIDNKIYENLIVHDEGSKPTEKECTDGLAAMQAAWDFENANPATLVRKIRNRLLAETDWTQLKDIDLDIIRERNWKNYRQALRDLPANSNPKLNSKGELDMSSVTWPDKPST
tara:strand:- start:44 stop:460 length:417 start_codon:yes stop_codon:yes gene_type:complete